MPSHHNAFRSVDPSVAIARNDRRGERLRWRRRQAITSAALRARSARQHSGQRIQYTRDKTVVSPLAALLPLK